MLTREGGHLADRIVHAGGDATGAEVQRALHEAVRRDPWIRLVEHALVLDLLPGRHRPCLWDHPARARRGRERRCGRDPGARGGAGHRRDGPDVRRHHQPGVSTGDGVALAMRAGAAVTDMRVRAVPSNRLDRHLGGRRPVRARQPLISEALRGEGAHLVDGDGKRFMVGQHELAELAPGTWWRRASTGCCWPPARITSSWTPAIWAATFLAGGSRPSWRPAWRSAWTRSPI